MPQPADYVREPARTKSYTPNGRTQWLVIMLALLVPTAGVFVWGGTMSARIDAIAQDTRENGVALSTTPTIFVPRMELNAKLENIQLQVGAVKANVEELKEQSERQTAEIIRRIERIDTPRGVQ